MRSMILAAGLAASVLLSTAVPSVAFGEGCHARRVACPVPVRFSDVSVTRTRAVMVRPAFRTVVPSPAIVRSYAVPVVMRPGRWRTVVSPAVIDVQTARVTVPSRRWGRWRGAEAQVIAFRPIVVRPAMARRVYQPPVYGYIRRTAVVRPAGVAVIEHPPAVVLVRARDPLWRDRW